MAKKKQAKKRGRPKGGGKSQAKKDLEALATSIGRKAVKLATELAAEGKDACRYAVLLARSRKLSAKDAHAYQILKDRAGADVAERFRKEKLAEVPF